MLLHQVESPDCEDDADRSSCSWLYAYRDGEKVDASLGSRYALALYFATGELMGNTFGDISPVTDEELVFFLFSHLVAGFVNAYLIGGVVGAISSLNAKNQAFYGEGGGGVSKLDPSLKGALLSKFDCEKDMIVLST